MCAGRRRAENGDYARGALCTVCYASWQYQDVSDLRPYYWWPTMKKDVAEFVARCLTCQQVKAEHQAPAENDAVWVIVDRLTKTAHFLPIRQNDSLDKLAELYVSEIVRLHGIPTSIVSDRDPRFTSHFWGSLHRALGKIAFQHSVSSSDRWTVRKNDSTLEDMMRACVIEIQRELG
ncbi:UNVERIFIED_CONTAM: hypothetical protein Sradi_3856800 [Sesamum radiatum]|uniref:Integrase zinc-binding domain-containing protein n=1 Tax=Sesamum radiatum TaxID=300843 RepID=A0AAW2Q1V3_SESRA